MKNLFFTTISLFFLTVLTSCGGENKTAIESEVKDTVASEPVCKYSYNHSTTGVYWTAFKFTEKTGVKGKFDSIEVSGYTDNAETITDLVHNTSFTIYTSSVNSDNPERDKKIAESFFGKMMNTSTITGTIMGIMDNTATIKLKLNDVEKEVMGNVSMEGEILKINVALNMNDFNGQEAIASLNKVCSDLHKGTDGKSVLWSDVEVMIETTLNKTCE